MTPITTRPVSESDAPSFRELRLEALRRHPEVFSSDFATHERHPIEFWIDRARAAFGTTQQIIFVAEDAGALVGMMAIHRGDSPKTEHSALIWGAYVRPSHRGRHLGTRLVEACIDWARKVGVRTVKLAVVTTNTTAIRCYERSGFTTYGREPLALSHNGRDYDEFLMALAL